MRDEEVKYLEFLTANADALMKVSVDYTDASLCKEYGSLLSMALNTYCFGKEEILNEILNNKVLNKVFLTLSCQWLIGMSERYKPDYWDDRDKASVKICKSLSLLNSFQKLAETAANGFSLSIGTMPRRDTILAASATATAMNQLHSTLRQTFTGLVLSYLMQSSSSTKFRKEALSSGIISDTNVSFFMI